MKLYHHPPIGVESTASESMINGESAFAGEMTVLGTWKSSIAIEERA